MENKFYTMLMVIEGNQPCTLFHIKKLQGGAFAELADEAINLKYIEKSGTNCNGDDLYTLTGTGKKIVKR